MKRYFVEGRVIPERVNLNIGKIGIEHRGDDGAVLKAFISVVLSKIFIHVECEDISEPNIRNRLFTIIGGLINYYGFRKGHGLSYEIESITDLDSRSTSVFGVDGFVFSSREEFGERLTFPSPETDVPVAFAKLVIEDSHFSRATFELRNAIRYPDFTALHCQLAIEAIRNAFNSDDKEAGWAELRRNLRLQRETIEVLKEPSDIQRHGKQVSQSWEQRRRYMQISWEVVYRYERFLAKDPALQNAPLL